MLQCWKERSITQEYKEGDSRECFVQLQVSITILSKISIGPATGE